jgi:hypothetical protein
MVVNITECMQYRANGWNIRAGRRKCKYLDRGTFGGYFCKLGNQIDTVPRISKDTEVCRSKNIARFA